MFRQHDPRALSSLTALVFAAACSSGGSEADAGRPTHDASTEDAGTPFEAGVSERDAAVDAGPLEPWPPGTIAAVPGTHCELTQRIGRVEVVTGTYLPTPNVSGEVYDRPDPWLGEPERTTSACAFHRFEQAGECGACAPDELCDREGQCVKAPRRRTDLELKLSADGTTQTFASHPETGDLYGEVTLRAPFSAELAIGAYTITLEPMPLPAGLRDLTGTLHGGYDAPTGLDVTWSGPEEGFAFTRIPINHHAGGPTFTECRVPAAAQTLHVDRDMLEPLAVSTGLEFQGLEHVQTAAAQTPFGCVELRYTFQHAPDFLQVIE
jgi:hypothetical protein